MRSIQVSTLLLVLPLGAACSAHVTKGGKDVPGVLSYAQVQSLKVSTPAAEVVRVFGPPTSRLKKDDRTLALGYSAENAAGAVGELRIALDEEGRVERWTLAPRKPAEK